MPSLVGALFGAAGAGAVAIVASIVVRAEPGHRKYKELLGEERKCDAHATYAGLPRNTETLCGRYTSAFPFLPTNSPDFLFTVRGEK